MVVNPKNLQSNPLSVQSVFAKAPAQLARPFVKWVGGKTQLISQFNAHFPKELKSGNIETYVEPFVGGGAVFFHIAQNYAVDRFLLADTNADLILAYWTIRERVGQLITALHDLQSTYMRLDESQREQFYYKNRVDFNSERSQVDTSQFSSAWIRRTSQLIFLNKTCFNGLFRVNSAGGFNASFGKYENPKICDPDNLIQVSENLKRAEILLCDFQEVLSFIDSNSFVYIDPPYRPLTETANFTGYSASTFTALDQHRLAQFCKFIDKRNARLLISNSDPSNVDSGDRFFQETYPSFRIEQASANRMINCKAEKRGKITELLIMNY